MVSHSPRMIIVLFIKHNGPHITIDVVYVDDMIITCNDPSSIATLKLHLDQAFSIKDLGEINFFLGLEISHIP